MRKLFGHRAPPVVPKADDPWVVADGVIGGKPHLFRVRTNAMRLVRSTEYSEMIAISWEYETDASGMPGAEDLGRMKVLEDRLENCLETEGVSLLTVVVTGDGVREWQWYTRSVEDMMRIANEGLQGEQPFPVSFSHEHDPEWRAFKRFAQTEA
ncbi:MAG: DUF695 domain-containing protein [Xanthomonadales bacterium]|nr:DUF695 domain-containing protein [Xanthomonadales bacterium]